VLSITEYMECLPVGCSFAKLAVAVVAHVLLQHYIGLCLQESEQAALVAVLVHGSAHGVSIDCHLFCRRQGCFSSTGWCQG
jgi:hypothetical protein